jgi:hypothetical protein
LSENGADFNQFPKKYQWLPIHYYDDTKFDRFSNEELLEKYKNSGGEISVKVRKILNFKRFSLGFK